ncbi:hypothetical protein [Nonomuraea sp. NPDC048826]|uniref:hypothetical protein n=1 Tax=Nonomuraea sp. NPDC048826 TaxID=3364347 RepID=UPI0037244189
MPFGLGFSVLLVLVLEWAAPDVIPFHLMTFWTVDGPFWDAFTASVVLAWPVMAVGVLVTLAGLPRQRRIQRELAWYGSPEGRVVTLGPVTLVSRSALEEIVFRWLLFYAAIAGAVAADFLVLGFAGLHPVRWVFTEVLVPVADFATFGWMHAMLTEHPWTVAAAILTSNGRFRNTHGYQGLPGWIWSWYMGMCFFLVMFEHGLPAAIALHIAYNLTIMTLHLAVTGVLPRLVFA